MEHPNADLYLRLYRALAGGDLGAARNLVDRECVWHLPSRVIGGDFRGRDAMLLQMARYLVESGGTFRTELLGVLADDEHVVARGIARAERNGRALEDHWVQVAHVRDGRIAEMWHHPGDQHAVDEFWSSPPDAPDASLRPGS